MLDDEFEKIQSFLESQNKPEVQFLQKFDSEITEYINESYDFSSDKAKDSFSLLYSDIQEAYLDFLKQQEGTIKNFSISLILIKNILEKLNKAQNNFSLTEEQKIIHKTLIKLLIASLKEECDTNINHFTAFSEYIDNYINPLNIQD